jgi:hypothetical protein
MNDVVQIFYGFKLHLADLKLVFNLDCAILGGKMEPYMKRCCATKLTSAEKLMYICKNQLGKYLNAEMRLFMQMKFVNRY